MGIVAGYVRVSSRQQRDEGDSPANQKERLRAVGCEVFYEDLAISGYSPDRRKNATGWRDLQDAIRKGEISKLVATRLDRFARRDSLVLELVELCDEFDVDFGTLAQGSISTRKAIGWFSVKQQLLMDEFYSRQLSENISAGYEAVWGRGKPARGPLPFHLQRDPKKPAHDHVFVASPAWGDARKAVEMFLDGQPTTTCASFLRGKGHIGSRSGFLTWIRNPILQGHAGAWREDRIRMANIAPPLVTPAEAEQIEFRLQDNRKRWGANAPSNRSPTILPLSRICSCWHCGKKLHQNRRTGKPRKDGTKLEVWYLRCGTEGCEAYLQSRRHEEVLGVMEGEGFLETALGAPQSIAEFLAASDINQTEAAETIELREELKALEKMPEKVKARYAERITELKQLIKESRGQILNPLAQKIYRQVADDPTSFIHWLKDQSDEKKNQIWEVMTDLVLVDITPKGGVKQIDWSWGEVHVWSPWSCPDYGDGAWGSFRDELVDETPWNGNGEDPGLAAFEKFIQERRAWLQPQKPPSQSNQEKP